MSDVALSDLTAGSAFVLGWLLASAWSLYLLRVVSRRDSRDSDDAPGG